MRTFNGSIGQGGHHEPFDFSKYRRPFEEPLRRAAESDDDPDWWDDRAKVFAHRLATKS
jgi:hypothetical protein